MNLCNYIKVKRRDLERALKNLGFSDTGKGSKHAKWSNGKFSISVPRHNELKEGTCRGIIKEAENYKALKEKEAKDEKEKKGEQK